MFRKTSGKRLCCSPPRCLKLKCFDGKIAFVIYILYKIYIISCSWRQTILFSPNFSMKFSQFEHLKNKQKTFPWSKSETKPGLGPIKSFVFFFNCSSWEKLGKTIFVFGGLISRYLLPTMTLVDLSWISCRATEKIL